MGANSFTIDPKYKTMLQQTFQNASYSTSTDERNKILAMGMVEGDLGADAQDKSKSGGSANFTGFNLNQGMLDQVGTLKKEGLLPENFNEQDLKSGDYKSQMAAAAQLMDAFYKEDGTGDILEHWIRCGSATATEGFDSYNNSVKDTVKAISDDSSVWTDNKRFGEDVPYQ